MNRLLDKEKLKNYLLKRTLKVGDCWRFTGTHVKGYGKINIDQKGFLVHRLSAYIFHGLDLNDSSMMALHKPECKFRDCWSGIHIYVGNNSDNIRDSVITKTHVNISKTHCPKDHPYSRENTYITLNRWRQCKICQDIANKARRERNKRIKARKQA